MMRSYDIFYRDRSILSHSCGCSQSFVRCSGDFEASITSKHLRYCLRRGFWSPPEVM